MNISEFDNNINKYNLLINILEWDKDFIAPEGSRAYKSKIASELIIDKHNYILRNFPNVTNDGSRAYELFYIDYLYSYGLSNELEKKMNAVTAACIEKYKMARKKCDYNIVREEFANLVACKVEEIACLRVEGDSNYEKLLNYFCGKSFVAVMDDLMNSIKKALLHTFCYQEKEEGDRSINNIGLEEIKDLFIENGVITENVVFQKDVDISCLQIEPTDCRMTYSQQIRSNAAKHEMGHIIYMQNISKELHYYVYQKPLSLVFDEAIALLYEMILDDYGTLKEKKYTRTPIRIECTNLQRLMHIVLRYELERDLLNEKINPKEVDKIWNEKFKKLFGYQLESDNEGILQDSHWFMGAFGYFPVYNAAFALALIIYEKLELYNKSKSLVLSELKEKILVYGASKDEREILDELGITDFVKEFKECFSKLTI